MKLYSILKLNTGEELYTVIHQVENSDSFLTLENPMIMEEYFAEDGSHGTAMVRWCTATDEDKLLVMKSAVISVMAMSPSFMAFYKKSALFANSCKPANNKRLDALTEKMEFVLNCQLDPDKLVAPISDTIH